MSACFYIYILFTCDDFSHSQDHCQLLFPVEATIHFQQESGPHFTGCGSPHGNLSLNSLSFEMCSIEDPHSFFAIEFGAPAGLSQRTPPR